MSLKLRIQATASPNVIPAKAALSARDWTPAFAGLTELRASVGYSDLKLTYCRKGNRASFGMLYMIGAKWEKPKNLQKR